MPDFWRFLIFTDISGLAGAVLHELTHYAIWTLTNRTPTINWRHLAVTPHTGPDHITHWDRAAAAAPLAIGLTLSPLLLAYPSFPLLVGWIVYTLGGARSDYEVFLAKS